jgi:hypothetical protein
MKCFVTLILLSLSASLWAAEMKILKCLGKEEKRFHLNKQSGPVYDLNQRLISEMIQIPRISLQHDDAKTVCTDTKFSESWKLLELSIKKGKDIFFIPSEVTGLQREMAKGMIEDYVDATREILLNFISQIQTLSPTPTCLKEEIPELDVFFTEVKYLQADVDLQVIFKGKDQKIFEKLKHYPQAFEKCRARLKKNAKPVSTKGARKR